MTGPEHFPLLTRMLRLCPRAIPDGKPLRTFPEIALSRRHAAHPLHLEHQFRTPAHRPRRQIYQGACGRTSCACRRRNARTTSFRSSASRLGYEHIALNGQKGYHGVAMLSRLPFEAASIAELLRQDRLPAYRGRCSASRPGCAIRSRCIISTCRPAATFPIPTINPKFAAQARLPRRDARLRARCAAAARAARSWSATSTSRRSSTTSGATSRCSRSSRTRRSSARSSLGRAEGRRLVDAMRACSCRSRKSSTPGGATAPPDWAAADRGRRLDHIWVIAGARRPLSTTQDSARIARLEAPVGPRAGDGDAGGVIFL